jgi:CTP synthase
MKSKFIFVIGGVMSGVGKGITAASIGRILKMRGFKVTSVKIDPYLNVDAGTMNPVEHGEVFVMDDGTECDQDIGNYERFLEENLTRDNYLTTGKVYQSVIKKERNLEFKGRCVEVIPDIPNEAISTIKKAAKKNKADFTIVEIGGTIGEYQGLVFLEAARMMKLKNPKNVKFALVSFLPIPEHIGEMKTKPTQTASRLLNETGIQADFVFGRSKVSLDQPRRRKISISCNVEEENIISAPNVDSIYEVLLNFEKEKLGDKILKEFGLRKRKAKLNKWKKLVKTIKESKEEVTIGIVGKYFKTGDFVLSDSYISVIESIKHAAWSFKKKPVIKWLSAEKYEKNKKALKELNDLDGIIVPGGFGSRGTEGKINVIQYCRENKIPYFGLCLGMQLAVIEFARHVCGLKDAHSTELNPKTKNPVIDIMADQKKLLKEKDYGGTMRLGSYKCALQKGTKAYNAYGKKNIEERHRHRYEFNNQYHKLLKEKGIVFAGKNPKRDLVEIIELKNHPFFIGVQFHPELKSRPLNPHPLFKKFIKASIK